MSQLLAPIAAALPDGSEVLIPDIEFTSGVYPFGVRFSHVGGNIRFGFHLYNDEADVDAALNAVTDIVTS